MIRSFRRTSRSLNVCAKSVKGISAQQGQIAVAWALHNPAVTAAIVGARNAKQVEGNVGAAELHLTNEEIAEIEGANEYEPRLVTAA